MGVASIRIDQPLHPSAPVGQPGRGRDDLVLGDPVIARNSDDTDVIRWVWALVDVPIGSAAVLSSTTAPQVTFTPDVAGSYLLRLMVDDGVDGQIDHKIAAVRDADGFRYPATDEVAAMTNWPGNDEKGWGKDTEDILRGAVGASNLAGVLAVGNTTGANNISINNGQAIVGAGGGSIGFTAGGDISITPVATATCTGDFVITGKLTVGGLIDPTGLVCDEQAAVPFVSAPGKGTFWVKDTVPCTPMFTGDTGVDSTLATTAGTTLAAVLTAGNTVSNGQSIVGQDGGSLSFEAVTGVVLSSTLRATTLWVAGAESGDGPAAADNAVIGDGSAADFGATVFSGPAAVGGYYMTDTAGAFQGAVRYDHAIDSLYFDAGAGARAYVAATGLHPNATATYDLGLTGTRWRDLWCSRSGYFGGGVSGHDANADDLSVGDGSATPSGATFYSTTGSAIYFADTLAGTQGGITYAHGSDTLSLRAGANSRVNITSTSVSPESDAAMELGLAAKRWTSGYFSTALIVPLVHGVDFGVGSGAGTSATFRGGHGGTTGGNGADGVFSGGDSQAGDNSGGKSIVRSGAATGTATSANVELTVGSAVSGKLGVVHITNTSLEFGESATTPGAAIAAGRGRFWVSNEAPSRARFTDDTNNSIDLSGMPTITMGVGGSRLSTTNPASYGETGGLAPTINFANGVTQTAHWWIQISRSYLASNLIARLWWTGTTASAVTNVRWRIGFDRAVNARNLAIDNTTLTLFTEAGPSAIDLLKFSDWTLTNADMNSIVAGDMVRVQLSRIGADGADTYTGTAEVIGLQLYL